MSIIEVAKVAGVSKTTVARVINREGNVAPETISLVHAAMEKLNYKPPLNRRGRKPSAGKTVETKKKLNLFALILPEIKIGLYSPLQHGFDTAAGEIHHQIMVCNSDDNIYKQFDAIGQLIYMNVAGIGLVSATQAVTPPYQIKLAQQAGIPVVLLHRDIEGVEAPVVELPMHEIGHMAGQALTRRGHRRVAFFSPGDTPSARDVESGLREALHEVSSDLSATLSHYCTGYLLAISSEQESLIDTALDRMLSLPDNERPTAVMATNDNMAEILYFKMIQRGLKVPEDIALIGFGAQQRNGGIRSHMSSITFDAGQTGSLAVGLLNQMSSGERPIQSKERISIPLSLWEGKTLG
ncbi:MAG: LacI family DNA-binding transcriptional regulator [Pirellulales bacterium]|nr:LacI family DNA-binding transcriptional regulator [Pirellulales bacterium]